MGGNVLQENTLVLEVRRVRKKYGKDLIIMEVSGSSEANEKWKSQNRWNDDRWSRMVKKKLNIYGSI